MLKNGNDVSKMVTEDFSPCLPTETQGEQPSTVKTTFARTSEPSERLQHSNGAQK